LAKLLADSKGNVQAHESTDIPEAEEWESSKGLDNIIKSMSNTNLEAVGIDNSTAANSSRTSELELTEPDLPEPPPPSTEATPPTPSYQPVVKGTLSVSGAVEESSSSVSTGSSSIRPRTTSRKPVASKKPVAKKLAISSSADNRLESFESVERRAAKAQQEKEDLAVAISLQNQIDNEATNAETTYVSSGRVAAAYSEVETSIYKPNSASLQPSTSIYSSNANSNKSSNNSAVQESNEARMKYSNAKSISSDQFFNRDEEDTAQARNKLNNYSNANAISSDMLYNEQTGQWVSSSSATDGGGLGKLKDTVKGFFDDIQRRIT
jgi:hypothetical protein